jgi:hypothetical protein
MNARHFALFAAAGTALALATFPARADTPIQVLAFYTGQAGAPPVPERGEKLFTTNFGRDLGLSCSSCHGAIPIQNGKDQVTEKSIAPMAPAVNPKRFTDRSRTENWFRLNCRDVIGRECTAAEKADVLSWLISLKP